jgi:cellulose synthase/poly-beta-1,6-N-acetylglucosamine synthase-like glycosyltransferase
MINFLLIIFSFLLLLYLVFVVLLTISVYKKTITAEINLSNKIGISIIIPFKNEANNLKNLLYYLLKQDYNGPWEIILVNDCSTDNYIEIIKEIPKEIKIPIKIIDSFYDENINLTSKQQALDNGVKHAKYEWCLFTDADMIFEKKWLSYFAANASNDKDMIFGHTTIIGKDFFSYLQKFQLEFLFAVAYSFHKLGISSSCMGNNLMIKKDSYIKLGGQKAIGYSIVEDRDLYNTFRKNKFIIEPVFPFSPLAATLPCSSINQFYHQMLRWARGGFRLSSNLLYIGILFGIQNFAFLFSLFGMLPYGITLICFVNFIATIFFLHSVFNKISSTSTAFFFPIYYLFLLIETIIFLISFVITPQIKWKNKKL